MNGNHIAVLDTEVVANNSVDTGTSVIKLIVGEDNEDGILSLLSSYQNGITAEELKLLHGCLREGNNAVVIVDGIGNPDARLVWSSRKLRCGVAYMSWLGFFFFFRMAVAVSSSCIGVSCAQVLLIVGRDDTRTCLTSAPEVSLKWVG